MNSQQLSDSIQSLPKWHNLFFDHEVLIRFMQQHAHNLLEEDGLGTPFLLTRGVRPILEMELNWDCEFNRPAATHAMKRLIAFDTRFSRQKLWIFGK
jgi:hypothetical protein